MTDINVNVVAINAGRTTKIRIHEGKLSYKAYTRALERCRADKDDHLKLFPYEPIDRIYVYADKRNKDDILFTIIRLGIY